MPKLGGHSAGVRSGGTGCVRAGWQWPRTGGHDNDSPELPALGVNETLPHECCALCRRVDRLAEAGAHGRVSFITLLTVCA